MLAAGLGALAVSPAVGAAQDGGGAMAVTPSSVVAGMQAGFRRCYNKGLAEDPNMRGSVRITAKIGPSRLTLKARLIVDATGRHRLLPGVGAQGDLTHASRGDIGNHLRQTSLQHVPLVIDVMLRYDEPPAPDC